MTLRETSLPGAFILEPRVFEDERGFFMETWSRRALEQAGVEADFVQDNHALSRRRGTLRGLHFQRGAAAQAKLMRCVRGAILDVAVDLRPSSPTYRRWLSVKLSGENKRQLYLPKGFAHGYLTLADATEVLYKADAFYQPDTEGGIRWDDPDLGIEWGVKQPILTERDAAWPYLRELGEMECGGTGY